MNEKPEFVVRIENEYADLVDKLNKLYEFIQGKSEVYVGLSDTDKMLLDTQYSAMHAYAGILFIRLQGLGDYVMESEEE